MTISNKTDLEQEYVRVAIKDNADRLGKRFDRFAEEFLSDLETLVNREKENKS